MLMRGLHHRHAWRLWRRLGRDPVASAAGAEQVLDHAARHLLEARVVVQRLAVARTRAAPTSTAGPSVAPGPTVSGTMRSASRTASSTSFVTITTVFWSRSQMASSSSCRVARVSASRRREGLVEQQHGRIGRERARDRHPLAHAAGQLGRPLVAGRCRGHQVDVAQSTCARRFSAGQLREHLVDAEGHVLVDGQPGQQRVVLEDDAAVGPRPRDRTAVEQDGVPRRAASSPAIIESSVVLPAPE